MSAFVSWLTAAPQGAIAILTAALAALVAVLVAVLTQWVLGRRALTELLTKKLEELYLVLNEISAHNLKRVEEAFPLATATPFNKRKISGGSVERQGLDLHKKVVMLVRLYFPKLATAHQAVLRHNSEVNMLIYEAESGPPLSDAHLLELSGAYRDALVAMEEELIENRRILVQDHILPGRYKHAVIRPTPPPAASEA
jgi:hypothetical protein